MYHTIIAVDVEGFGSRDGPHQTKVREGLVTAMATAFERCQLPWDACHSEDRGDGPLVFLPPDVDRKRLVECLPNELAGCLRLHNATADEQAKIRLRIVLHSGEIDRDIQGYSSPAVVHASRLLESAELKDALKRSSGILALITSDEFFRNVVMANPAVDHTSYRRAAVEVKETHAVAWICLPDHHGPLRARRAEHGRHREPARVSPRRFPTGLAALTALLLASSLTENVLAAVPPDDRCAEPVQLNVNVSVEKAAVIGDLAAGFEDSERDEDGCKAVTVQVTKADSADAVITAIGRGWVPPDLKLVGPEPHVLLPDSSWEYDLAADALRTADRTDISLDNRGSIASSPLVLVRPRLDDAEAAPQPTTWKEVLKAARQYRAVPGAETFRPSPVTSGAGIAATVALYSVALGENLDRETVDQAAGQLHDVEVSVPVGDESETLLCWLWNKPGGAVLVSEKSAADFNDAIPTERPCAYPDGAQLEITHPRQGTVYLDHPFVTVGWHDRPVNEARDQAVDRFHEYLTGPHGRDQLRRARLRDRDGDVEEYPGVPEVPPRRLRIGTVDVPAVVDAFSRARKPARVQVLVDVSKPMSEPFNDVGGTRLRAATDAVKRVLRPVGNRDKVGLWSFAAGLGGTADHRVLVPLGRNDRISEALGSLNPSSGASRVNDTLRAAVEGLHTSAAGSVDTVDAVLVIADGTAQEGGTASLVDHLRASGVSVFLIAFGTGVCESTHWHDITTETDGVCHEVADTEGIQTALDRVAAVLWGGGHG